jgi:hypothetical protein
VGPGSLLHSFLTKGKDLDAGARSPTMTSQELATLSGVKSSVGSIPDQIWRTTEMALSHSLSVLLAKWGCWNDDNTLHAACQPIAVKTTTDEAVAKCGLTDVTACTADNTMSAIAAASKALIDTDVATLAPTIAGLNLLTPDAMLRFRRADRPHLRYRKHASPAEAEVQRDEGEE